MERDAPRATGLAIARCFCVFFSLPINPVDKQRKQFVGIAAVLSFESPGERGSVSSAESAMRETKREQNVNNT